MGSTFAKTGAMIEPELLELVRCPQCKGELAPRPAASDGDLDGLACMKCRVLYPIVDDLPQLLAEEARPLPS